MRLARVLAVLLLLAAQAGPAAAAEIRVLSVDYLKFLLPEAAARFERGTGHQLVIEYETAGVLRQRIEAGVDVDVAILTLEATDELMRRGFLVNGPRGAIARFAGGLVFTAAMGADTRHPLPAEALIQFLMDPAFFPLIRTE